MDNQAAICKKIGILVGFVLNICVSLVLTLVKIVSKESKSIAKDFEAIDNEEAGKVTPVAQETPEVTAEEIKELVGGEVASNEADEVARIKEEMARLQKSLELAEQKVNK